MVALAGTLFTVGWVVVWLMVMAGGVWQILRGRSGAGACIGLAAILGLATQLCGGMTSVVTGPLSAAVNPQVGMAVDALLLGCAYAVVLFFLVLGAVLQRPPPPSA